MEHKEEGVANQREGYAGQYECRWCTGTPEIPAPRFTSFLMFIDHLVQHIYAGHHRHEAVTMNPHARLVRGEPPFAAAPVAWHKPERHEKILEERKIFLSFIADWIEWAFVSIPELNSIGKSSILVADRLVALMRGLPQPFREQRDYLLKHEEKLRETGKDPKWPITREPKRGSLRSPWQGLNGALRHRALGSTYAGREGERGHRRGGK